MRKFENLFSRIQRCQRRMSSASSSPESEGRSSPERDSVSRGSSASTGLREEYEDLLRYAVVTPVLDRKLPSKRTPLPRSQSPAPGATRGAPLQTESERKDIKTCSCTHILHMSTCVLVLQPGPRSGTWSGLQDYMHTDV